MKLIMIGDYQMITPTCQAVVPLTSSTRPFTTAGGLPQLTWGRGGGSLVVWNVHRHQHHLDHHHLDHHHHSRRLQSDLVNRGNQLGS